MDNLKARRDRALGPGMREFYDFAFHPVEGKGVWVTDADGNRYLDAYNNVPHVGHSHPRVAAAVQARLTSINTNTRYLDEHVLIYAEALLATMPAGLDTVLLTCSGTEANDLAWRLACAHTGGSGAIATSHAYHGNSTMVSALDVLSTPRGKADGWVATVTAPADRARTAGNLRPAADRFAQDMDAALATLAHNGRRTAAFYFDPLFATDDLYLPEKGVLDAGLQRLRAAGGLAVADEVQPGFGRLGQSMWGFQAVGIVPDIVTMGKATGNGYPLGAVVTRREIVQSFRDKARYFNTFGGSPGASAAGLAVLQVIESEGLIENARTVGDYLASLLNELKQRHALISEIRGSGFFQGVELLNAGSERSPASTQARRLINLLCKEGVLVGLTGKKLSVLKIRPPMVFGKNHADILVEKLDRTLSQV